MWDSSNLLHADVTLHCILYDAFYFYLLHIGMCCALVLQKSFHHYMIMILHYTPHSERFSLIRNANESRWTCRVSACCLLHQLPCGGFGAVFCSPCTWASPFSPQHTAHEAAGVHGAYLCLLTSTNSLFLQATAEERTAIITTGIWMWQREAEREGGRERTYTKSNKIISTTRDRGRRARELVVKGRRRRTGAGKWRRSNKSQELPKATAIGLSLKGEEGEEERNHQQTSVCLWLLINQRTLYRSAMRLCLERVSSDGRMAWEQTVPPNSTLTLQQQHFKIPRWGEICIQQTTFILVQKCLNGKHPTHENMFYVDTIFRILQQQLAEIIRTKLCTELRYRGWACSASNVYIHCKQV